MLFTHLCVGTASAGAAHPVLRTGLIEQDTIVRMAGTPRQPGISHAVAEITIAGLDLPDGGFGSFGDALLARDGKIWIAEGGPGGSPAIYVFDSLGHFVRQVGQAGAGPGEYRAPRGLAQLRDGRVLVRDALIANRVNVYHPDGRVAPTWTFDGALPTGLARPRPVVDTAGFIWIEYTPQAMQPTRNRAFVRLNPDGGVLDTVPYPVLPEVGARGSVAGPLSPRADALVSPMGFIVTYLTSRYAIDLRIPMRAGSRDRPATWRSTDPVVSVRRTSNPVRLSDAERRDHEAFRRSVARGGQMAPIPDAKPPIRNVRVDDAGRLWVQVAAPSVRRSAPAAGQRGQAARPDLLWEEPQLHDVFGPDGAFIGTVQFPTGTTPVAFARDRVLCFVRLEDGDVQFVRFRIPLTATP